MALAPSGEDAALPSGNAISLVTHQWERPSRHPNTEAAADAVLTETGISPARVDPCEQEVAAPVRSFRETCMHGASTPGGVPKRSSSSSSTPGGVAHIPTARSTVWGYTQDNFSRLWTVLTEFFQEYVSKPTLICVSRGSQWPGVCICSQCLILLIFIIVGLATQPMDVDTDFDSFLKTDVLSSLEREGFWAADRMRPRNVRRLQTSTSLYEVKDLYIVYELKSGTRIGSLLHERALTDISDFERGLIALPEWGAICAGGGQANRRFCDPGISMPGYVIPTMVMNSAGTKPDMFLLDGQGWDPLPQLTTKALLESENFKSLLLPNNYDLSTMPPVSYLRSAFRFKFPIGSSQQSSGDRTKAKDEAKEKWEKFVLDTLLPAFEDDPGNRIFRVYYDGTDVKTMEITKALESDMKLCIGSVLAVLAYLLFHTRSFLLTFVGLLFTLSAVPFSYVVCSIVTGTRTVNFTSFLAIFLVVGFGCDVIFVYTDFWVESTKYFEEYSDRLVWTYARAGRASFVTTATTALSFFANLASVIRALRQFGFFMGLCVMFAWATLTLLYAPLCVLDERIGIFRFCGTHAGSHRARAMARWCDHLHGYRRWHLGVPCLILFSGLIMSCFMVKTASELPSLFPEEHNRNKGETVISNNFAGIGDTQFKETSLTLPQPVTICSETNFSTSTLCSLHWCEVLTTQTTTATVAGSPAPPSPETCHCHRKSKYSCSGSQTDVVQRYVTSSTTAQKLIDQHPTYMTNIQNYINSDSSALFNGTINIAPVSKNPLVQQFWESGFAEQKSLTEVTVTMKRNPSSSCGWYDICYCNSGVCSISATSGWQAASPNTFTFTWTGGSGGRLLQSAAPIFTPTVSGSKRAKVRVAFGLEVNTDVQLLGERPDEDMWKYLSTFEMRLPWTQRNIYDFCEKLWTQGPQDRLKVTRQWCWFLNFKNFLQCKNERFPVPSYRFNALALEYINCPTNSGAICCGTTDTPGVKYVWVVDGVIKAMYMSTDIDVNKNADSDKILDEKKKWDAHLDEFNRGAVTSAKGAFHFSESWVEAEASAALIMSAALTLVILLTLAFLAMVCFTLSLALSMIVVGATLAVIAGLAFFMVVIMQWEIALIEVIAMVYFIGYAVTYSLHITHKYAHLEENVIRDGHSHHLSPWGTASALGTLGAGVGPLDSDQEATSGAALTDSASPDKIRYQRSKFAIVSMGGATLGSAATTAGSSFFLAFATLTIFQRLGAMCLIVTLLSFFVALGPLPSVLLMCGPLRPGQGADAYRQGCVAASAKCGLLGCMSGISEKLGLPSFDGAGADLSVGRAPWGGTHPSIAPNASGFNGVGKNSQASVIRRRE